MSVVSKPSIAFYRKRLAGALAAVSLCMLLGACGNDDRRTGHGHHQFYRRRRR